MAKEPFGIICSPASKSSGLFPGPMGRGFCHECGTEVVYDMESLDRVKEVAAKEGVPWAFVCENCSAHQMSTASDEQLAGIRQRFRDMGNPALADMLDMFSNDDLREFFAKLKRPVQ